MTGKNEARVVVRWEFKCLGDKLGAATYEYTLQAVRYEPKPVRKIVLQEKGTTKKGSLTTTLPAGDWQLQADPFLCETDRGAGSTAAEVGQTVKVPDFCSWIVSKTKGAAELEQGAAVKRVRRGTVVVPGAAVVTRGGAAVSLASGGRDAAADVYAASRLAVDSRECRSSAGGWKLSLGRGGVAVATKPGPEGARPHTVVTPNASSTADVATWVVTTGTKSGAATTTVAVRTGSVAVTAAGKRVLVRSGLRTRVTGKGAPSLPTKA